MHATVEPLQVEVWSFGGRAFPIIPITVAEAATLRRLSAGTEHGLHHLGQVCGITADGIAHLHPLCPKPSADVTVAQTDGLNRRLHTLCSPTQDPSQRLCARLDPRIQQYLDWQDVDSEGVADPLTFASLRIDVPAWCRAASDDRTLGERERLIWSRLERAPKPTLAVEVVIKDTANCFRTVLVSKQRKCFIEEWLIRRQRRLREWMKDAQLRLCYNRELRYARPELERVLVVHWCFAHQLAATPFTAWRREAGISFTYDDDDVPRPSLGF